MLLCIAGLMSPVAAHANGHFVAGHVYCDLTGLPLDGIKFTATSTSGPSFTGTATSDQYGYYEIALPIAGGDFQLVANLDATETVIFPSSGALLFSTSDNDPYQYFNWVIGSPRCSKPEGMCWLTGGGAKFDQILGFKAAQYSRTHSFGGNVYPGCSSTAGDGGQWNDVDAVNRRHFQGFHVHVDRCGNVDGIPPGSSSPQTPFNFIEFSGTGRVQGIKGNKEKYDLVYFTARCEDRNEPGSNGETDGNLKDRYFLHVFSDPSDRVGSTLLLVDGDGDPLTVDPVAITDGNLQIHISSCDATASMTTAKDEVASAAAPRNEFWFATSPNPTVDFARIRFGLPRDADVAFRVFDVSGRMVRLITSGSMSAGDHSTSWDLRSDRGTRVGSGMYFLQMRMNGQSRVQRIVVP
jgi:hypothetical protein